MRRIFALLMLAATTVAASAQQTVPDKSWIKQSNVWTQMLLDVQLEHSPEGGSAEGLVKFDKRISDPTLADEKAARRETEAVLAKIKAQQAKETNKQVAQDLEILRKAVDLQFRQQDFSEAHDVPFINASESVFGGLKTLLDDQVKAERRPDAVIRLRKYAGTEPGYKPFTDLLKQREIEQMEKPGMLYPSKGEIETEMGRDSNYVEGIADLFKKYKLTGWEESYAKLKVELTEYDAWIRANILPKARTDFRLAPEEYTLAFEGYGIDIPPAQLAAMAHAAFTQIQGEMAPLAAEIARKNGYPSSDYRAVIAEMKKKQITGEAILPFFTERLHAIEKIIVAQNLVTLPDRPAIIRLATAAETAEQPAPHMEGPALLNNTGERGQFVLPLNIPSATGGAGDKYDDDTYDAAAWTLTAHEARPGHELQFDSMVEHGVSLARVTYAFNSTNVEGWGLYSEYIMQPFEPVEGQLITLQNRLLRAARAFLDSELQSGKLTPEQVYTVLEKDVVLSHAFAKEEVERFTYRMPGQANSYFYGYVKLLALRKDTEAALGAKFDQKKFHDFILDQGLLPPDLMRKAVMEDFVPRQN
jgi:uncharacterized protein (DUF885 family)